jgi:hypothetical protein
MQLRNQELNIRIDINLACNDEVDRKRALRTTLICVTERTLQEHASTLLPRLRVKNRTQPIGLVSQLMLVQV